MIVQVCIPYRHKPGTNRARAFDYTWWFWRQYGWNGACADSLGTVFCSATARNYAAIGKWDVAVFVDADKIMRPGHENAPVDAVRHAYATGEYTVFHDRICYLSRTHTDLLLSEKFVPDIAYERDVARESWEDGFAIRRDLWDEIGGYDRRFVGYGYHGIALAAAAGTIGGRHRIPGTLVHLWHPKRHRNPVHLQANKDLCDQYLQHLDRPHRMRKFLKTAR